MMKKIVEMTKDKIPVFTSMESRMACGIGACLGCTIETKSGMKRVCKEGPVFPGKEVIFLMIDTKVDICGIEFKNPVIAASGTFGFGREYEEYLIYRN